MATRIEMPRGDTRTLSFTITENGSAKNITGATIYFTVRNKLDDATSDSDAVLQKSQSSHSDAANGLSSITINPSDTNTLTPKSYVYDISLIESGGAVTSSDTGTFVLERDVTRTIA